jgi:hypothetical protein
LQALEAVGEAEGFTVHREYPVTGGRIDLVWLWGSQGTVLGLDESGLPILGFEIESSWRTRKHIKGDYLNLFDLAATLGVIVLLGEGKDVEATRRLAEVLVDRPGPRIVIWTEDDARRILRESGPSAAARGRNDLASGPLAPTLEDPRGEHSGRYRALWAWLRTQEGPRVSTTFAEIEEIIGMPLPPSARKYAAHWAGYEGSAVARAIRDAGWRARHVDLLRERVMFVREAQEIRG